MLTVVLSPLTTKRGWYSALTGFAMSSINARPSVSTPSKYSQWILVFDFPGIPYYHIWSGQETKSS